jgi:tetratricopeptide (TPR) repeat protein
MASTQIDQDCDHISEYIRLFSKLHTLVVRGDGSTDAANELREDLDYHWRHLTADELTLADALAIDLAAIGTERTAPASVPDEIAHAFESAKRSQDWQHALEVLRSNEPLLPPDDVASLRGICWARLGHYQAAALFLDDAIRLKPTVELWRAYFRCLVRSRQFENVKQRALKLVNETDDPYLLFIAADVLYECARAPQPGNGMLHHQLLKDIVRIATRATTALSEEPRDELHKSVVCAAQLSQAICFELLGERERAIEILGKARSRVPGGCADREIDIDHVREDLESQRDLCHRRDDEMQFQTIGSAA